MLGGPWHGLHEQPRPLVRQFKVEAGRVCAAVVGPSLDEEACTWSGADHPPEPPPFLTSWK